MKLLDLISLSLFILLIQKKCEITNKKRWLILSESWQNVILVISKLRGLILISISRSRVWKVLNNRSKVLQKTTVSCGVGEGNYKTNLVSKAHIYLFNLFAKVLIFFCYQGQPFSLKEVAVIYCEKINNQTKQRLTLKPQRQYANSP